MVEPVSCLGRIPKYWLEALIVLFAAALVCVTFFQVINRFILHLPISGTEEAARFLSIWAIMLGSAYAVRENTHIQVDVLVVRLPGTVRVIVDTVTNLLAAALLIVIIWQGIEILEIVGRRRSPALRLSMFYVYVAGPVGAGLMLYFIAVRTIRMWKDLRSDGPPSGRADKATRETGGV